MSHPNSQTKLEILEPERIRRRTDLRTHWRKLTIRSSYGNRLYSSEDWFFHLAEGQRQKVRLAVFETAGRKALLPMVIGRFDLNFGVGRRVLASRRLDACRVLGSGFLGSLSPQTARKNLRLLLERLDSGYSVVFPTVPHTSPTWKSLADPDGRSYRSQLTTGRRPWRLLELPATFDDYLRGFSRKSRQDLRRRERRLEEGVERMEFRRFTEAADADEFIAAIRELEETTWQGETMGKDRLAYLIETDVAYRDLARRGLVRSYVLYGDGRPLAFFHGYQKDDHYCLAETGFCRLVSRLSPGRVLMFKLIRDLIEVDPPRLVSFGVGDAPYKKHFSNDTSIDGGWIVYKTGSATHLWTSLHALHEWTVDRGKAIVSSVRRRRAR